ncbi:hypothetical protein VMCG_10051 [Cytospora schulzeri]|uniref:Ecp2 effector protein-like domain-containing protein n=1 Tax=Cytospora schulzeri TaxID=448051 RepID=A0A423VDB5_9PEZI|nr:hypothetical protein VMCG_10051 [Valsa malicola]
MKFLAPISVLLGFATHVQGVASAIGTKNGNKEVDPIFNQTEAIATNTFINTTTSDGWPPFYSTSNPQKLCGDTTGYDKSSQDAPDSKDCATLRDNMDGNPGLWNITADSGRPVRYILLASHGTCAFVAAPLNSGMDCLIGSEDVRDLLNDQATEYAKYSISSNMGCTDNAPTSWAIIHTV